MYLNELREVVGEGRGEDEEEDDDPEVEDSCMLGQEAVNPEGVPTQRLHDLQVVQLVPFLCKVHLQSSRPPDVSTIKGR